MASPLSQNLHSYLISFFINCQVLLLSSVFGIWHLLSAPTPRTQGLRFSVTTHLISGSNQEKVPQQGVGTAHLPVSLSVIENHKWDKEIMWFRTQLSIQRMDGCSPRKKLKSQGARCIPWDPAQSSATDCPGHPPQCPSDPAHSLATHCLGHQPQSTWDPAQSLATHCSGH